MAPIVLTFASSFLLNMAYIFNKYSKSQALDNTNRTHLVPKNTNTRVLLPYLPIAPKGYKPTIQCFTAI